MSGTYDLTLAAGATGQIPAMGTYVKVLSAPNGPVRLKLDAGEAFRLFEGQGLRLDGKEFRDVNVVNLASSSQTVLLVIGDDRFEDTRITGVVSITDGEKQKVLDGIVYRGIVNQAGGGVGQPIAQLFNPSASTKNVFLREVLIGSSAADTWGVSSVLVQAPTLVNSGVSLDRNIVSVQAITRSGNDATAYGTAQNLAAGYIAASTDRPVEFKRPKLIRPNEGVIVNLGLAASSLRVTFEWEEWPL